MPPASSSHQQVVVAGGRGGRCPDWAPGGDGVVFSGHVSPEGHFAGSLPILVVKCLEVSFSNLRTVMGMLFFKCLFLLWQSHEMQPAHFT